MQKCKKKTKVINSPLTHSILSRLKAMTKAMTKALRNDSNSISENLDIRYIPKRSFDSSSDLERCLFHINPNCTFMYVTNDQHEVVCLVVKNTQGFVSFDDSQEEEEEEEEESNIVQDEGEEKNNIVQDEGENAFVDIKELQHDELKEILDTLGDEDEQVVELIETDKSSIIPMLLAYHEANYTFFSNKRRMRFKELSILSLHDDVARW